MRKINKTARKRGEKDSKANKKRFTEVRDQIGYNNYRPALS